MITIPLFSKGIILVLFTIHLKLVTFYSIFYFYVIYRFSAL